MGRKGLWGVLLAGVGLVLGACDDAPKTNTYFVGGKGVENFLTYATQDGPMLVRIHGNPFQTPKPDVDRAILERMNSAIQRRVVRFTDQEASAPQPSYRVNIVLNAPESMHGGDVCRGKIPETGPGTDRITVRATFCIGEKLWVDVGGWLKEAEGPEDPKFLQLIWQLTNDMFPGS